MAVPEKEKVKLPPRTRLYLIVILAFVVCTGGTIRKASQTNGHFAYSFVTVTLWVEVLKLVVSTLFTLHYANIHGFDSMDPLRHSKEWFLFFPPAFLYALFNNLDFLILIYLDPATMSLVHNLKIFFTACFMNHFLRKVFTMQQWVAVIGLVVGVIASQSQHLDFSKETSKELHVCFSVQFQIYFFRSKFCT